MLAVHVSAIADRRIGSGRAASAEIALPEGRRLRGAVNAARTRAAKISRIGDRRRRRRYPTHAGAVIMSARRRIVRAAEAAEGVGKRRRVSFKRSIGTVDVSADKIIDRRGGNRGRSSALGVVAVGVRDRERITFNALPAWGGDRARINDRHVGARSAARARNLPEGAGKRIRAAIDTAVRDVNGARVRDRRRRDGSAARRVFRERIKRAAGGVRERRAINAPLRGVGNKPSVADRHAGARSATYSGAKISSLGRGIVETIGKKAHAICNGCRAALDAGFVAEDVSAIRNNRGCGGIAASRVPAETARHSERATRNAPSVGAGNIPSVVDRHAGDRGAADSGASIKCLGRSAIKTLISAKGVRESCRAAIDPGKVARDRRASISD